MCGTILFSTVQDQVGYVDVFLGLPDVRYHGDKAYSEEGFLHQSTEGEKGGGGGKERERRTN